MLNDFTVDNEEIGIVQNFTFLGSIDNENGHCTQEIRRRLILGRTAMKELETIIKDKTVKLETKIKIVCTGVFVKHANTHEHPQIRNSYHA